MFIVTTTMDRHTKFIKKVIESRFVKVRDRQVNKFNKVASKRDVHRDRGAKMQSIGSNGPSQAPSNSNDKCIINLSNTPLTQAQESLLSKGPNFAIASNPPILEYITAIETAFQKLNTEDAEELRADINGLLRKSYAPRPNHTKKEGKH